MSRSSHSSVVLGLLSLLVLPQVANGQTFKCVAADGSVSYQQQPCAGSSSQSSVDTNSAASGVRLAPDASRSSSGRLNQRMPPPPPFAGARLTPGPAQAKVSRPALPPGCKFPWNSLPADTLVYAVTTYGGASPLLDFPIDTSGSYPMHRPVVVNAPGRRVALLLSFPGPTVWAVRWTDRTDIVAVWSSGDERQVVTGLSANVPVLSTRRKGAPSACGHFAFGGASFSNASEMALRAFGQSVQRQFTLTQDRSYAGDDPTPGARINTFNDGPLARFEDPKGWRYGMPALSQLRKGGYVREAKARELGEWWTLALKARGIDPATGPKYAHALNDPEDVLNGLFVVERPFSFPIDMYGGNSRNFLVPKGMPVPKGDAGHSTVYNMNDASCCGTSCPNWIKQQSFVCKPQ
jgi:hypothetical protein